MKQSIRDLRLEREMTQKELADAISVSKQSIQLWEAKAFRPSPHLLLRLASFFEVRPDELDIAPRRDRGRPHKEYVYVFELTGIEKKRTQQKPA